MLLSRKRLAILALSGLGVAGSPTDALACGGFFCSQTQTVNQAAERIVFSVNDDGTVTAIIQIQYEGPSENFSWLLPIPAVPESSDLALASDVAFQRLQAATNPSYFLTRTFEGECAQEDFGGSAGESGFAEAGAGGAPSEPGGPVSVEARGIVGPFEWEALSVDTSLPNPADVAVSWLTEHGYDVPEGTPGLLRPYLEEGLYLLALRLTKGVDSGSIRPIVLTYPGSRPSIPVRPTAVAANDDMGVMTWVLSDARAVPQNYYSLELNEARLNWFNPNANYNQLVTLAADEAGGQGFVTEMAGSTDLLPNIWSPNDESNWTRFVASQDEPYMFREAYYQWGGWDGFWETVRSTLEPPDGATWDEVEDCFYCYDSAVSLSSPDFLPAFEANVIEPVRRVQRLLDSRPVFTRLYTTLSAQEMTVDPLFTFNPDLPDVNNVHTATQVIECSPEYYESEAPYRIELPQGGVVRGNRPFSSVWPEPFEALPANFRIRQLSETGEGRLLEDNEGVIQDGIDAYNATVPTLPGSAPWAGEGGDGPGRTPVDRGGRPGQGGTAGRGGTTASGGTTARAGNSTNAAGDDQHDPDAPESPRGNTALSDSGCGCSLATAERNDRAAWAAAALGLFWFGRRRKRTR